MTGAEAPSASTAGAPTGRSPASAKTRSGATPRFLFSFFEQSGCRSTSSEAPLLPLPQIPWCRAADGDRCLPRGTQQRRALQARLIELVNASVVALNDLAGVSSCSPPSSPSEAQLGALCNLWDAHLAVRPDEVLTAREAFLVLRGQCSPAYGLPTNLASYRKDAISLPTSALDSTPLADLLPDGDRYTMANFEQQMMLSDEAVQRLVEVEGDIVPYCDPVLRSDWRQRASFIRRLERAGMIRFSLSRRERCTPFFVKKKNDSLRLIIDARRFNRRCKPPPYTPLGSVPGLLDIELNSDET